MHFRKDPGKRQATVSRKRAGHPAARCHDANCCEQEAHQREHEQADTASDNIGGVVEDLQEWAGSGCDDCINIF